MILCYQFKPLLRVTYVNYGFLCDNFRFAIDLQSEYEEKIIVNPRQL